MKTLVTLQVALTQYKIYIQNDFNDIHVVNTYVGQILKKNAQYIFYLHIFIYLSSNSNVSL
jgi:hypothetical protein